MKFDYNWRSFLSNLHKNLCCGCSLESPWWGDSNEHQQHRFLWRNKKNYPLIVINYHQICNISLLLRRQVMLILSLIPVGHPGCHGSVVWVHPGGPQQERVWHPHPAREICFPKLAQTDLNEQRQLYQSCGDLCKYTSGSEGYKTFFMLNSAEHEIYPAHKC